MTLDAAKREALRQAKARIAEIMAPQREADRKARKAQRDASSAARKAAPMKDQRQPRVREPLFLSWVRRLPCIAGMIEGGCTGPIEAAHLRFSDAKAGRINSGMQAKPDDRWCTGLCAGHHRSDQHKRAERAFWARLGVDASAYAMALHDAFLAGDDGAAVVRRFAGASTQAADAPLRREATPNLTKESR